jgi:hypothetical protein
VQENRRNKARIDSLFDKEEDARQTPWDRVKIEPGQPTVKRVKRFWKTLHG